MKWYALFVKTGKEEEVKKSIQKYFKNTHCKCYVPKRIVPEKKNGQFSNIVKMMFPGYILLQTKMSFSVYHNIMKLPNIRSFLNYSNIKDTQYNQPYLDEEIFFQHIPDEEISQIKPFIGYESDIMDYSLFGFNNEKLSILSGPLVGMEERIKKIDKRKRRAKLSVNFMGGEKWVDVGFELECPTINILKKRNDESIELRKRIELLIREVLQCSKNTIIENKLINNGINSLLFIQFILKLESELDIKVSDNCMSLENWSSIDKIIYCLQNEYNIGDLNQDSC
ncbi:MULTISPECIES: antiterminator LoaP [Paenibacillus]|uniref:antiterminator LoaP n=1 Tax=Paenibacillus TaxID=44249 RepID=UPI0013E90148|nr:antiterminator LoaP [Paenibacillus sp. EKM211P]KAF6582688.1 antiterminator LoaP [Paenibacillus sp. EKM211P]MEE4562224.1 antiterminator LoaP [Paenibacillus polymyxa]